VNRRFQAKLAKSKNVYIIKTTASIPNQILHSDDKDNQIPFVGGPNTCITNQDGSDGRHLGKAENRHISAAVRAISTKFGTMQFDPLDR